MKNNPMMTVLRFFLVTTVITGIIYPLSITGIARVCFPGKVNGSLIRKDQQIVGSTLIGQRFDSVIYFTTRPSAVDYNTMPSGASNFALTNKKLKDRIDRNRLQFINFNRLDTMVEIPAEMLFTSASGLDPHISPGAAFLQVDRIVKARNFDTLQKQELEKLILRLTEPSRFLYPGKERINVLLLNLETDRIR
jgi:K+-transporting ATPase ATPase C chain